MPLYLFQALDHPGKQTRARRAAARVEHMKQLHDLRARGHIHDAGALLDDEGDIVGSLIIYEARDIDQARSYAAADPFAREGIWAQSSVWPYRAVQWQGGAAAVPAAGSS